MVGGAVRELRAIRDHTRMDDIFGTIGTAAGGGNLERWIESRPLPAVPVRAIDSKGKSFSTQTDERGAYAFSSLPAGTYKIESDLPKGFERSAPFTAAVSGGTACRVDNFATTDGRIDGTILDAAGKPVAGFVTIQPADPTEAEAARLRGGLPGYDVGPDGKFSLPHLPPGRYRLVCHPKIGRMLDFRTTFYWPSDPGDAIDLTFGQHIDALEFKVPL
jgi:hypothetical protein